MNKDTFPSFEETVDAYSLAQLFNISYYTINRYARSGMPHQKKGRSRFFNYFICKEWIDNKKKNVKSMRGANLAKARAYIKSVFEGDIVIHLGDVFKVDSIKGKEVTLKKLDNDSTVIINIPFRCKKIIVKQIKFN